MAGTCNQPLNLLLKDEKFQKLQSWYPKTHPLILKTRLERFRNEMLESSIDSDNWFPSDEFHAAFTSFMQRCERAARIERAEGVKKEGNGNRMKSFSAALSVYNHSQLADAVDRITSDFVSVLNLWLDEYPEMSGVDAVKKLGGWKKIMDAIFSNYEKITADDVYKKLSKGKTLSSVEEAELKELSKRIALELNTMPKFKEYLIARSAGKISELTGVEADYDGLIADWKKAAEEEVTDDDDEQNRKNDGVTKGASYVDVRMKRVLNTLTADAKRIISDIPMLDENGNEINTVFGITRMMDYSQVAYPLFRVIQNATPENFMDKLKSESERYPWMKSLYNKLNGKGQDKWRMRAIIYTNFKKSRNEYYTIYVEKKKYATGLVNSEAKGSTVIRHMFHNLNGIPLGSKYAIYDSNGGIRKNLDYKKIQDDISVIINMLDGIEMREGRKPADKNGAESGKREAYWGLSGEASMRSFIDAHGDMIDRIVEYARGVGLDIYREDVERAGLIPMPETKNYPYDKNRLTTLVSGINAVYGQARSGNYEDADALTAVIANSSKKINFAIARALYDEVEERALVNGKSISALQNTNVVHQVTDMLSNADNLPRDAYVRMIKEEFADCEGFSFNGKPVGWVGELIANPDIARNVRVVNLLNFNNVEYTRLNDGQRKLSPFIIWRNNEKSMYELQIQADYEHNYEFVNFVNSNGLGFVSTGEDSNDAQKKLFGSSKVPLYYRAEDGTEMFSRNAPIVGVFMDEVMAELERIEAIESRAGTKHKVLPVYESNGKHFQIFPEFNDNGFREIYNGTKPIKVYDSHGNPVTGPDGKQLERYLESQIERDDYVREQICRQLQKIVDNDIAKFDDSDLDTNPYLDLYKDGELTENARGELQEFFLNNYYARIQMDRLYAGGFSHFPNRTEYEKRCGFMHAPHSSMYTEGMRRKERHVVYIGDDVTASAFLDQEITFAKRLLDNEMITPAEYDAMIQSYKDITSTDGQGLVTMSAFIQTKKALGEWDENVQGKALERIRHGKPKPGDIAMFMFDTTKLVGAGFQRISAAEGSNQKPIRAPFFHKYSEIPLLGAEFGKYTMQARTEISKGLSMAEQELRKKGIEIDMFLFKSGCKLSANSVLQPLAKNSETGERKLKTAEQIKDYLVKEISSDPETYIQKVDTKYYGKAASLPKYNANENITTASQAVKAVAADIENEDVEVDGRTVKASWARDEHDRIEAAETIEAYKKVSELIGNNKELEEIFQRELASKSYSSEEAMHAMSLLENGEFAAQLFTPTFAKDVQSMLLSIISQRMTRPASRGAHIAQFTSVGMDVSSSPWDNSDIAEEDLLGVQFEGEGESLHCVGIDSYLPIYDSKLEIFADENGSISPARLRELVESGQIQQEALYYEAYRTPSDYTHSVLPMIAKGLSANIAGGRVAVSKEAMKMTGHDYDGDELNCHFYELELVWDRKELNKIYSQAIQSQLNGTKIFGDKTLTDDEFAEAIGKHDAKNRITKALDKAGIKWRQAVSIRTVGYDFSQSPEEGRNKSKAARSNAKLRLRRSILTSPAGSARLFIPGSNDESTIYAKTLHLLRLLGTGELQASTIYEVVNKMNAERGEGEPRVYVDASGPVQAFDSLSKLTIDEINRIYNKIDSGSNPYSYAYAVEAYKRVIGGASMIDVFALNSGAGQMLQRADLYYKPRVTKHGYVMNVGFFGKRINKLYNTRNIERLLASLFMSRMVQSAVDNNKNPILGMLNQTQQLSKMMNFLSSSGLSEKQIHLIFNQPAIIELANRMSRRDSKGLYGEAHDLMYEIDRNNGEGSFIKKTYQHLESLEATNEDVYKYGAALRFQDLGMHDASVRQLQVDLLRAFMHLNSAAEDLDMIIKTTRPEASSATVGPSVASTSVKLTRLDDLREKVEKGKCRIGGIENVIMPVDDDTELGIDTFAHSPIQRVTALNSLMYDKVMGWMRKYMPQARTSWYKLAVNIAKRYDYRTLQEGTVQQILNDMLTWKILENSSFAGNIEERRRELLDDLPDKVKTLIKSVRTARDVIKKGGIPTDSVAASLVDNAFIRKLVVRKDRIYFQPGGVVTEELRNKFVDGWAELVESKDENVRKLATDLYEYNLFTNGMRFGMYEFAHLAPMSVMNSVPSLSAALDNVLHSDFNAGTASTKNLVRQYYMNHWQDDKLIPVYNEAELPNGLREQFGFRTIDTSLYEHPEDAPKTVSLNEIKRKFYICVAESTEESGKRKEINLYQITINADGSVSTQRVSKLGKKGKRGQMYVHYNPQVSHRYFDIKDEIKDAQYAPDGEPDYGQSDPDSLSVRGQMANAEQRGDPFAIPGRRKKADAAPADRGTVSEDDGRGDPFMIRSPKRHKEAVQAVENLRNSSEEADAKNDGALADADPDRLPIDYGDLEFDANEEDVDTRAIESYVYDVESDEDEDEDEDNEEEETEGQTDNTGKEFYIGKRDGSDVSILTEPVRPWSVRQARKQRAYVKLRKAIEDILRSKGISIGVLNDIEARMDNLYGVTDFDKAHITVEGLKEMIRLSEGVGGLVALPEEFGHLALGMLGESHPLVARLLSELSRNSAARKEAFEGQYEEYERVYEGDQHKLTVEAAGKLVAKALLREQEIRNSGIRSLVRRVVDAIKALLRTLGLRSIEQAQYDAEQVAGRLARELLSGRLADQMDLSNISESGLYYKKAKEDITEWNDVVSKVLKIEEKRLKIFNTRLAYNKNKGNNASVVATEKQIELLKDAIKKHKTEDALISYFGNATDFLNETKKSLVKIVNGRYGANVACKKIDMIRDTIDGFKLAADAVDKAINAGEISDSRNLKSSISNISHFCTELMTEADRIGLQYFQEMMRDFYGNDGLEVTLGKDKGKKISIEKMTTEAPKDISFFSRWVHSMGNCNDLVLKAIDSIVRGAKQRARTSALNVKARVDVAFANLQRATGSNDQSFMFEYKDGKKTGKYISEEASKSLSPAKKAFYDAIMDIKKEIDLLLPESLVEDRKIVMMRKKALEKAKESNSIKGKAKYIWEAAKNTIMDTSDDIDFDHQEVEVSFRGNRVDRLPVLYTNKGKSETYDDMVDDVATSVLAYGAMAYEYANLNAIIGQLENAKYMSAKRRVAQHTGSRQQRETISDDDITFHESFTVEQAKTRIQEVLNDFFCMHVYGHIRADEGTIGRTRISKGKVVQTTNALTSMTQLGFNITQRIANISVGQAQIIIQTAGKGMFSMKDITWAAKEYMKNSADRLLDTGKLTSDNYLSLFSERFDIRQDNGRVYKDRKYDSKWISRVFNNNLMYAGLTMGEDALACTTAMALARNFKVRNAEGKEDNIWNAYEVKYLDETNKTGAHLELKKGWTNLDGSEITQADENRFTSLCAGVNADLQGIYNLDDKSAMQQYAFGSLIMMYRKWMAPALKLRYAGSHYDALRGTFEEGYYTTTGRFLWDSINGIINEGEGIINSIRVNWQKMTPYEKTNIHKAARELAIIAGAIAAVSLLEKLPPEDDENKNGLLAWGTNMLIYQLYRLRNELGAQAPTPLFAQEALKILKSPFAAVSLLKNFLNVWKLFLPSSYTTTIKSGAYKGHSKAYGYFWNMPVLSMRKQIDHFVDPSPMIQYYRNDVIQ